MSVTIIIIVLTALISFLAFNNNELRYKLIFYPYKMEMDKEYYRFISSGFIHADMTHLLFNMITLFFFGSALESVLNPLQFSLLYLSSIVISQLVTYGRQRRNPNYMALGASGAVSAVLFSVILLDPWGTIYLFFIPIPGIIFAVAYLFYSRYMSRQAEANDNIAHDVHYYGAIYGVIFMIAVNPQVLSIFWQQLIHPSYQF